MIYTAEHNKGLFYNTTDKTRREGSRDIDTCSNPHIQHHKNLYFTSEVTEKSMMECMISFFYIYIMKLRGSFQPLVLSRRKRTTTPFCMHTEQLLCLIPLPCKRQSAVAVELHSGQQHSLLALGLCLDRAFKHSHVCVCLPHCMFV